MDKKQNNWDRLNAVIEWANMSANYFARYIGLPHGENLYQVKRGNNGISRNLAERIIEKFPQINKLWLLTGEGSMFADANLRGAGIPYYNADIEALLDLDAIDDTELLYCPMVGDSDLAINAPNPKDEGDKTAKLVLFLKKQEDHVTIPGEEYIIVGPKIVTLRRVRSDGSEVSLTLYNEKPTDEDTLWQRKLMTVQKEFYETVYRITAKLYINQ